MTSDSSKFGLALASNSSHETTQPPQIRRHPKQSTPGSYRYLRAKRISTQQTHNSYVGMCVAWYDVYILTGGGDSIRRHTSLFVYS